MSEPFSQPLRVGDLIDERYEVRQKARDKEGARLTRYLLFDRQTGRIRWLYWTGLHKMFHGEGS